MMARDIGSLTVDVRAFVIGSGARQLAPGQVVLPRLAGQRRFAPDAEPLVAELERDPEQAAGPSQPVGHVGRRAGDDPAQLVT